MASHDFSPSKTSHSRKEKARWKAITDRAEAAHAAAMEQGRLSRRDGITNPRLSKTTQERLDFTYKSLEGMFISLSRSIKGNGKHGQAGVPELRASIGEYIKCWHQLALDGTFENQERAAAAESAVKELLSAISANINGDPTALDRAVIDSLPEVKSKEPITRVVLSRDDLSDTDTSIVYLFANTGSGLPIDTRRLAPQDAEALAREHGVALETRNIELPSS